MPVTKYLNHMSRHTDQHYLDTHRQLKRLWQHADSAYGRLTPIEQWQLHDYFQPSKDLTDAELLKHRAEITRKRPALPQQAGKALTKLYAAAATLSLQGVRRAHQPMPAKYARQKVGQIQVYGVVKPEIDLEKLAKALLEIAKDMGNDHPPEPGHVEDHAA